MMGGLDCSLRKQSEGGGRLGAGGFGAAGGVGGGADWSEAAGLTLSRTVAEIWARTRNL